MNNAKVGPQPNAKDSLTTWLGYLASLHPTAIELSLERVRRVAERLPLSLTCVKIVVGGTNGKGSTCAFLEAIYLAAGFKVGLYTSPHLTQFNERARINGEPMVDEAWVTQFEVINRVRGEISLTIFEFTTLAALLYFAQANLDVVVLEVGLGGRFDVVNIVDAECAIVTSVALDHMKWLGDTREQIGYEKAHIYRSGCAAICADPAPPQTLLAHAHAIKADLWQWGHDYRDSGDRQQWAYLGRHQRRYALPYPALRGSYQRHNACTALAAIESLSARLPVTQQAVRQGLLQVRLRGRFQVLPGRPTVILDVAHNPHGAAVLRQSLDEMGFYPYTYAVFGVVADKDLAGMVKPLAPRIDRWFCAGLSEPRGQTGIELAQQVRQVLAQIAAEKSESERVSVKPCAELAPVEAYPDPVEAYTAACAEARASDRIIIFGSFMTVGAVLAFLGR